MSKNDIDVGGDAIGDCLPKILSAQDGCDDKCAFWGGLIAELYGMMARDIGIDAAREVRLAVESEMAGAEAKMRAEPRRGLQ